MKALHREIILICCESPGKICLIPPPPPPDAHSLNSKVFGRQMASRKRISRITGMRGSVRKRGGGAHFRSNNISFGPGLALNQQEAGKY
jgi:hypothetical protein